MARSKYLSLEEARKLGCLDQFAREHNIPPKDQHPRARERFEGLLDAMAHGGPPSSKRRKPKSLEEAEQT